MGKYKAVVSVYTVALIFSGTTLIALWRLGNPDWGVIAATYLGYWLAGLALAAIGMFASSLTSSTTVAFVIGAIIRAPSVMHGKTSPIHHTGVGVFEALPSPLTATRYHSLVVDPNTLPDCLEVTAWTETADGGQEAIMGLRHRELDVEGVQFHPESILSEHGHDMLGRFLARCV